MARRRKLVAAAGAALVAGALAGAKLLTPDVDPVRAPSPRTTSSATRSLADAIEDTGLAGAKVRVEGDTIYILPAGD